MKHNNIRLYLRNGECYFKFKNQSHFVGERKDIDIQRINELLEKELKEQGNVSFSKALDIIKRENINKEKGEKMKKETNKVKENLINKNTEDIQEKDNERYLKVKTFNAVDYLPEKYKGKLMFKFKETADILNVHCLTISRWVREGKLQEIVYTERSKFIPLTSILQFLETKSN